MEKKLLGKKHKKQKDTDEDNNNLNLAINLSEFRDKVFSELNADSNTIDSR